MRSLLKRLLTWWERRAALDCRLLAHNLYNTNYVFKPSREKSN